MKTIVASGSKLVKQAGGKQIIKLTKSDWEKIGIESGWIKEEAKKKKKVNPWAVCTKSVGRENEEKFESCVMDIKKKQNMAETNQEVKVAESKEKKSPTEHGFFEQCVKENPDAKDPEAYCASVIDKAKGTTKWRKGPKKD